MPAPKIRGDYDSLTRAASSFSKQAQAAQEMTRRVKGQMGVLQSGDWIGRGAQAFYQEMEQEVLPSLNRLANALDEAGRVTQKIRGILQKAEAEAARLFGSAAPGGSPSGTPTGVAAGGPAGGTGGGGGGIPGWLSSAFGALGLTGASLTGLGALASKAAGVFDSVRAARLSSMIQTFARGGEEALEASGISKAVARWTTNAARATAASEWIGKVSEPLGKVGAAWTAVNQGLTSSAQTVAGKLTSAAGAGGLAWASRGNPVLAVADLGFHAVGLGKDSPSAIVGHSVDNIVTLGESAFTGSTRGLSDIQSRNLSGQNGWVFQKAAEAGDYWADKGISGGLSEFWGEVKSLF